MRVFWSKFFFIKIHFHFLIFKNQKYVKFCIPSYKQFSCKLISAKTFQEPPINQNNNIETRFKSSRSLFAENYAVDGNWQSKSSTHCRATIFKKIKLCKLATSNTLTAWLISLPSNTLFFSAVYNLLSYLFSLSFVCAAEMFA